MLFWPWAMSPTEEAWGSDEGSGPPFSSVIMIIDVANDKCACVISLFTVCNNMWDAMYAEADEAPAKNLQRVVVNKRLLQQYHKPPQRDHGKLAEGENGIGPASLQALCLGAHLFLTDHFSRSFWAHVHLGACAEKPRIPIKSALSSLIF